MNRYQTIVNLGVYFTTLVDRGLMPAHLPNWKNHYEAYLAEKQRLARLPSKTFKTALAENVAAQLGISCRTLYSVIKFMESQ